MSEQAENDPVLSKMTSNILEARNLMVEAHGLIESETEKLRREKEAFEEVTKKLEHVHFGSSVKLNVGGTMYRTSLETLRKDTDSMLSAMFSGRFDLKPDEDGAYFIDRDGELFRYILNYLRNGELLCSAELPSAIKKPLLGEARFYQVQSLVDELSPFPRVFNMSTIIRTRDQENALLTWLADEPQLMDAKWTVLFRASRDGWEPEEFHARCDGMSPTLTVVRSRSNAIFGGYTEEEWSSPENSVHATDARSFLFTLKTSCESAPEKVVPKVTSEGAVGGIICDSDTGPQFGSEDSTDLSLMDRSAERRVGDFSLGKGYYCPSEESPSYFTDADTFEANDVEVLGLKS